MTITLTREEAQQVLDIVQDAVVYGTGITKDGKRIDPASIYKEREWQGLTDEEIKEIVGGWGSLPIDGYTRKLFDQIEAKLKEKNNE